MADIPEEFVDPIVSTLMTDPVKLPHSNVLKKKYVDDC